LQTTADAKTLGAYAITQGQAVKGEPVYYRIVGRDAAEAARRLTDLYEKHQVDLQEDLQDHPIENPFLPRGVGGSLQGLF
jgi:glycine cleavage system regulatory protein